MCELNGRAKTTGTKGAQAHYQLVRLMISCLINGCGRSNTSSGGPGMIVAAPVYVRQRQLSVLGRKDLDAILEPSCYATTQSVRIPARPEYSWSLKILLYVLKR